MLQQVITQALPATLPGLGFSHTHSHASHTSYPESEHTIDGGFLLLSCWYANYVGS